MHHFLVDDFGNDELVEQVRGLPAASKLLENERRLDERGYINIERLMSRLDALMPYDYAHGANNEYAFLLTTLRQAFIHRIKDATASAEIDPEAFEFARQCANLRATFITFNYDCYLDQALYASSNWNPLWGYGFFCRPAYDTVSQEPVESPGPSQIHLLKLHGSINWRPRLGYKEPVALDAIVHHDKMSLFSHHVHVPDVVERHLEREPAIVPPVLTKSGLVSQPALRVVWDMAFRSLTAADAVTFIGYSLPPTDLLVQTLFKEALNDLPLNAIRVVDLKGNVSERDDLTGRYREVLGEIPDDRFYFDGARNWIRSFSSDQVSHSE